MLKSLPNPYLSWMSRGQIERVRNKLISLFLAPGEFVYAPPPDGHFGVSDVAISGGAFPCFTWRREKTICNAWLKVVPGKLPSWDYRENNGPIDRLAFIDHRAELPSKLVKHFSKYFPFIATNNYIQNNGEFIA